MMLGAASSLARSRPARARMTSCRNSSISTGSGFCSRVQDRRRDEPAAAQRDRDPDVHQPGSPRSNRPGRSR